MHTKTFSILILLFLPLVLHGRSPFRKKDPDMPEITIGWQHSKRVLKRFSWAYTEYPIFTAFNEQFFYKNLLPTMAIPSRANPAEMINCYHINKLIHGLLKEIDKH